MAKVEIGGKFGKLTVVEKGPGFMSQGYLKENWVCLCECGKITVVRGHNLQYGGTKSCGCFRFCSPAQLRPTNLIHGGCGSREYNTWHGMTQRCHNKTHRDFHRYGGRGIKVCDEWRKSFETFLAYVGKAPPGHSLDRIDNNGDYCPGNVRWATQTQQMRNTRANRLIEYKGQKFSVRDLAALLGMNEGTLRVRIFKGTRIDAPVRLRRKKSATLVTT